MGKRNKDPANISQEEAERLLAEDIKNLTQKVEDGKSLTAGERNLLQGVVGGNSAPTSATYAKNQVELAASLNVSRQTIQRDLKVKGCPGRRPDGRYDIAAWRAWRLRRGGIDDADGMSQAQLKAQQILLQNQKIEFQLGVLKKEYVPVSDVEKWGGELGHVIRQAVCKLHHLAPQLAGLTVPELEERLKDAEQEILGEMYVLGDRIEDAKSAI